MARKKTRKKKKPGVIEKAYKFLKTRKVTSGALVAALLGGVLKLTEVTKTFPPPADVVGNLIIFVAVLMIAIDISRGGLMD